MDVSAAGNAFDSLDARYVPLAGQSNGAGPTDRLIAMRTEPWSVVDSLATLHVMCLLDLADVQGDVERFVIQAARDGVDLTLLKALFPAADEYDAGLVSDLRDLVFVQPPLPPEVAKFASTMAPLYTMGSNNWAVAPDRSESGSPLAVNDPHLHTSRVNFKQFALCDPLLLTASVCASFRQFGTKSGLSSSRCTLAKRNHLSFLDVRCRAYRLL